MSAAGIPAFDKQNKAVEHLRSIGEYKKAKTVFMTPDTPLTQARVNAINDCKKLILPTAGLKLGFFSLHREFIPLQKSAFAVTPYGLSALGRPAITHVNDKVKIDLILTGLMGVDSAGNRLGDGTGFFDLECAILFELGCITENTKVISVCSDRQIVDCIPTDPWDVPTDIIITPSGTQATSVEKSSKAIFWEKLPGNLTKRIKLLHQLKKKI